VTDAAGGGAGELRLEVVAGNATGFTIMVDERLVIGRRSDEPGKLADDPELSRHHAEIVRVANGQFTIKDLSSTNGTFVNGTQLKAPVLLALDDEIEVGETKLVVRSVPAEALAPPPGPPPAVDVRAPTVTVDVPPAMVEPAEVPEPSLPVEEPPREPEPKPLLVRLTVDFEAEAAQLAVESGDEPIRLELADGQWRVADGGA
jgi:pSer/pThr/pTyr-binding forkhead associated (FHA) protein